ncbi:MAG: 30S ribosomal protein S7 [Deltaproteobacteria bacterium RBG_13_58_19]|nr:MAG: 30S ribosomal protein S7 [Deltaproteobacteria bacterium RBG_13_58_19]
MPRKGGVVKRGVSPDLKYKDVMVSRFINGLMRKGKKSVAQRIFYDALDIIGQRSKDDPLKVFHQAMDHVRPLIEVKSRRVGGATYQVPVEVRHDRRISLAIRWIINFAKARGEKSMDAKLAGEFLDAAQNRGGAIKKREDTHKMAEANKAFAHYRW